MGLDEIHQLTTYDVGLNIDIETFEGEPFTVKLQTFSVGNATTNYALHFSGELRSSNRVKVRYSIAALKTRCSPHEIEITADLSLPTVNLATSEEVCGLGLVHASTPMATMKVMSGQL